MGTAIGELPPYFVARAGNRGKEFIHWKATDHIATARLTEERLKQRKIDLLDEEEEGNGVVARLKQVIGAITSWMNTCT